MLNLQRNYIPEQETEAEYQRMLEVRESLKNGTFHINLDNAEIFPIRLINSFMPTLHQKTLTGLLLFCILFLTFWIRIQGVERIPNGRFTENDAYLYHWQANIIAEHGKLPARDMHRWLTRGRDNTQLLSLYAYAIAYTHKVFPVVVFISDTTLPPCSLFYTWTRCPLSLPRSHVRHCLCIHRCSAFGDTSGQH